MVNAPTRSAAVVTRLHDVLPLFRLEDARGPIVYAPGAAQAEASAAMTALERRARAAHEAWRDYATRPFEPECLTVYLSNACNLACTYCYSAPVDPGRWSWRLRPHGASPDNRFPVVSERAVVAAASTVAAHCVRRRQPFALNFHGGGEPSVHWALLQRLRELVGEIAAASELPMWAFVATNGVITEQQAAWLGAHFSLVGLSCDGPPDLHDRHRPAATGASTAAVVARTALALAASGVPFHVRATVTKAALTRQPEIVAYLVRHLGARMIRIEPAYQAHAGQPAHLDETDAEAFVEGFLEARRLGERLGSDVQLSGVRMDEIHGPYCHPLRDVLQVGPDGTASACFLTVDGERPDDAAMTIGRYEAAADRFVVDSPGAAALRAAAAAIPPRCQSCVNVYHCARDCPDVCLVTAGPARNDVPGLRCRIHRLLAHELIRERAYGPARSLQGA